jgi:hypothetical protein
MVRFDHLVHAETCVFLYTNLNFLLKAFDVFSPYAAHCSPTVRIQDPNELLQTHQTVFNRSLLLISSGHR